MALIKVGAVERNYELLPEGKYEVFVDKFDDVQVVDGIEVSRIMFTIRKDVDSANGGRKVFTNIKSSDNFAWLVNGLSKAVGIPVDSAYETLADFLNDIKGKTLVVKVRHKPNPKDATKPYVNITDFFPTTRGAVSLEKADTEII
jgi:hypothetical protein